MEMSRAEWKAAHREAVTPDIWARRLLVSGIIGIVVVLFAGVGLPVINDLLDSLAVTRMLPMRVLYILFFPVALIALAGAIMVIMTRTRRTRDLGFLGWVMFFAVSGLLLGAYSAGPALLKMPLPQPEKSCLNNQRLLSQTILIWAQDNRDTLPGDKWVTQLHLDAGALSCPTTYRRFHDAGGYGLNEKIAGAAMGRITSHNPVLTADSTRAGVLMTDIDLTDTRHLVNNRRGFIASTLDGHVQFYAVGTKMEW